MSREYMIGTLSDYPLLKVVHNGITYFVNEKDEEVFLDEKGLPKVEDEILAAEVLSVAK